MEREVSYITHEIGPDGTPGKDLEPRKMGLEYSPTMVDGVRQVQVSRVADKSSAEAAGFKKGDILVSVDGHPMSELVMGDRETAGMVQLKIDLAMRTGSFPGGRQTGWKRRAFPVDAAELKAS